MPEVIDADVELAKRCKQFPDVSSANLLEAMNEHWFPELIQDAIQRKNDFAFETNFRDETVMETVALFKSNGYQTHLFFVGISSLYDSVERVMLRVQKGGHDVSKEKLSKRPLLYPYGLTK